MERKNYYLGLDIGTDSVGYAVVDPKTYDVHKFKGKPAWGVQIFEAAQTKQERRSFRTGRRRLERRKQRVQLVQELFAKEIGEKDPKFFKRIKEGALYPEDKESIGLFCDKGFKDKDYYKKYPTIHHLITDLMENKEPHDVRLVYLACAWFVAHRGHFLSNIDMNHLDDIREFSVVYKRFEDFFSQYGSVWDNEDVEALSEILKINGGVSFKEKLIKEKLFNGKSPSKEVDPDGFKFSRSVIVKMLAGGKGSIKDLFGNEEYKDLGSISLGEDEEKFAGLMSDLGEDYEVIDVLRSLYDWATLIKVLGNDESISRAKVKEYEKHKGDLKSLKYLVKKYSSKETYTKMFRDESENGYSAYAYHPSDGYFSTLKRKASKEDFFKNVKSVLEKISADGEDKELIADLLSDIENGTFMPKQKNTDNRVIPYQLYYYELKCILKNASVYLTFLTEEQPDGISIAEKIESVFSFRIPYYVGPLNPKSENSWIKDHRKQGEIYPWNFNEMVDLDGCEDQFIKELTNTCTYLPGENVLPKDSLCYHRFMVLNEINNIRVRGNKIPVEWKQEIYNELFLKNRKVTIKKIKEYLLSTGKLDAEELNEISGLDMEGGIKSNLLPQIAYGKFLQTGILSEEDVERIIERASYAEEKSRLLKWLQREYSNLSSDDHKTIAGIKANDFGRLSRKLLTELEGVDRSTGELTTVMRALWETNNNLQEILFDNDKYSFKEVLELFARDYYADHPATLEKRLDDMYVSPSVRRPIIRTLDIVKDVEKAFGKPSKIFVEVTRGTTNDQKGKRTKSRKAQILELYKECKDEDVRILEKQLEAMGESAENRLQGDKLFLYFIQLGKCAYSGKNIDIESLGDSKLYDIDHIYPQSVVKDDSILNNKVLCLSEENGKKSDKYPIQSDIRSSMEPFWRRLKSCGLMTEEKYKRLTRNTGFTDEEKMGFINRQLVETSQAAKAVAELLKERFGDAEIVYCKARIASEFRQEFDCLKSRSFNDLHHAVDAYLNVVTGNVYSMKFNKNWFKLTDKYDMKTKNLYAFPVVCNGETIWTGKEMTEKVVRIARNQNGIRFNKFAYFKKGALFDQMPVKKAEGLTPMKGGLDTSRYGGYNKSSTMFFMPVGYKIKNKSELFIMSVEMMYGERFLKDKEFAKKYSFDRLKKILNKTVDEVSFPMGFRPWKVNTVLSLDGFRVCISGSASAGRSLIVQSQIQFFGEYDWQYYLKKLSSLCDKMKNNPNYIYSAEHDEVTEEKNVAFYDYLINKLEKTVYRHRPNNCLETVKTGRTRFVNLSVVEQAVILLSVHQIFGRNAGGCDLSKIGGVSHAASTGNFTATISNWKKYYSEAYIVDISPSGLWEKKTLNILELI